MPGYRPAINAASGELSALIPYIFPARIGIIADYSIFRRAPDIDLPF